MDDNNKYFRVSGWQIVIYALLTVLIIAGIYVGRTGETPQWQQCKESLFTQMFSDTCTPRRGMLSNPESGDSQPLQRQPATGI
ncbi:MAG: hypothetical protein ACON4P_01770 [Candidatus Puniceispirillales bacterium]